MYSLCPLSDSGDVPQVSLYALICHLLSSILDAYPKNAQEGAIAPSDDGGAIAEHNFRIDYSG
jgi:hypothetical protein